MSKRTHGKATLNPTEYEYVGAYDASPEPPQVVSNGMGQYLSIPTESPEAREYRQRMRRLLGASGRSDNNCTHCGAAIRYVVVWLHAPTGEHIATGETCASERLEAESRAEMDLRLLRKNAQHRAEQFKIAGKAAEWVEEHRDLAEAMLAARGDNFIAKMIHAVNKYGGLTERQEEAAVKAVAKVAEWMTPGATCELRQPAPPAPEGKVTVEGTVTTTKWVEGPYGDTRKMRVETAEGWAVWGTVPSSIAEVEAGAQVRFVATLERSEKDPGFAFYKRPSKAEVVA